MSPRSPRSFFQNTRGATAITFAISAIPVLLAAGSAFDYSRQYRGAVHLQAIADAAALAAASSDQTTEAGLKLVAQKYVDANLDTNLVGGVSISAFNYDASKDSISATVSGSVSSTFMSLAGFTNLNVGGAATALRGVEGSVEVALVLDNTWSMSDTDASGTKKIDALKAAAKSLVQELKKDPKADVKIGLVPYGDYVNVGTDNRSQPWISVGADYTTEKVCTTKTVTTTETCKTTNGPKDTCTKYVDGVAQTYTCYPKQTKTCTPLDPPKVEEKQSCSGGAAYKWYGCVASRKTGTLRLSDLESSTPYPGLLTTSQRCLNPIVPLTDNQGTVISAIDTMIINIGTGYYPLTYIPAGLIWGVNLLSPSAPYTAGRTYDAENRSPRKVLVLMTDGENTLRFNSSNGQHVGLDSNATKAATQVTATNTDTTAICTYAKAAKIEIFTIALAVDDEAARTMLQGCASGTDHYFDAADTAALQRAFADIARSLRDIRLES